MSGQVKYSFALVQRRPIVVKSVCLVVIGQIGNIFRRQHVDTADFQQVHPGVLKAAEGYCVPSPRRHSGKRDTKIYIGDMPVARVKIVKDRREQPDDGNARGARNNAKKSDDQARENIYVPGIQI